MINMNIFTRIPRITAFSSINDRYIEKKDKIIHIYPDA